MKYLGISLNDHRTAVFSICNPVLLNEKGNLNPKSSLKEQKDQFDIEESEDLVVGSSHIQEYVSKQRRR